MDWHKLGLWHQARGDLVRAELSFTAAAEEAATPTPKADRSKGVVLYLPQSRSREPDRDPES